MNEIYAGGTIVFDPSDKRLVIFDWDREALTNGVQISTSTWTITPIRQADEDADLTSDNEDIQPGARKTEIRLLATTASLGDMYWVSNKIITDESPTQEIEQRFKVLIQDQ